YIALGGKLGIRIVADGDGNPALQLPSGWVEDEPGFDVLHDSVEFTHNEDGMVCNTTMVDQFSVPIGIELTGQEDHATGFFVPGGRDAVFETLAADPDFGDLVFDDLRVIAPGHGLGAGRFDAAYHDPSVGRAWSHYTDTDPVVTTNAGTFTGRVAGDELRFDGGVEPIPRPSTSTCCSATERWPPPTTESPARSPRSWAPPSTARPCSTTPSSPRTTPTVSTWTR